MQKLQSVISHVGGRKVVKTLKNGEIPNMLEVTNKYV